jgi:stage II sporulation SpoAA-like protein
MSMQSKAWFAAGLLEVEVSGQFSLEEAKRNFLETLEGVGRHGATKVLIDGRGLKGDPEVMERFFYGEFAATETARAAGERNLPRVPRFAYVLEEPVLDPRRFGETVASNRGMIIKVFDNREEALEWLQADPAGKS